MFPMEGSHLKAESILRQEGQESKMRIYLRVPDELRNEVCDTVQETGIKTILMEKKLKSKMAVWGGLTNSCVKNRGEKPRRKGDISI